MFFTPGAELARQKPARILQKIQAAAVVLLTAAALALSACLLSACAGVDPLIERALDRRRQVWEEDRRPQATRAEWDAAAEDWRQATIAGNAAKAEKAKAFMDSHLEPDLYQSRLDEFGAQDRYRASR